MAKRTSHSTLFDLEPLRAVSAVNEAKTRPVKATASVAVASKAAFTDASELLQRYRQIEQNKYVSQEFQSFGCHIAAALDDQPHTALYIKLAKQLPRAILERSLSFVSDANARNKAKLFMWKLNQLKKELDKK